MTHKNKRGTPICLYVEISLTFHDSSSKNKDQYRKPGANYRLKDTSHSINPKQVALDLPSYCHHMTSISDHVCEGNMSDYGVFGVFISTVVILQSFYTVRFSKIIRTMTAWRWLSVPCVCTHDGCKNKWSQTFFSWMFETENLHRHLRRLHKNVLNTYLWD